MLKCVQVYIQARTCRRKSEYVVPVTEGTQYKLARAAGVSTCPVQGQSFEPLCRRPLPPLTNELARDAVSRQSDHHISGQRRGTCPGGGGGSEAGGPHPIAAGVEAALVLGDELGVHGSSRIQGDAALRQQDEALV